MGFKSAASATARWCELKKKIAEGSVNGGGEGEAATTEEGTAEASPTKAKGKAGAKGKKRKAETDAEGEVSARVCSSFLPHLRSY